MTLLEAAWGLFIALQDHNGKSVCVMERLTLANALEETERRQKECDHGADRKRTERVWTGEEWRNITAYGEPGPYCRHCGKDLRIQASPIRFGDGTRKGRR